MSFFIRKKHKNSLGGLTQPLVSKEKRRPGDGKTNQRNTDREKFSKRIGGISEGKRYTLNGKRKSEQTDSSDVFRLKSLVDKRPKFRKDEEIESSESDVDDKDEIDLRKLNRKRKIDDSVEEDEEQHDSEDDVEESAQEKKLRLAKLYLEEIEREEKERREHDDVDKDLITSRLKEDVLEQEGRLRKEVADTVQPDLKNLSVLKCSKYLKGPITCLCISEDEKWIYSASTDGHLIKWSVETKQKVAMVKRKEVLSKRKKKKGVSITNPNENSCHATSILAVAISSDSKFLATGDNDKQIAVWNPSSLKRLHIFTGHRGPIRGLVFRKKTHTLYSSSDDRTIRIWSLDEMGYVETLFGHQDKVTCIDALSRERAISGGGRDSSIRIWKIVEESQLVYNGHYNGSIDCVKLINEENFLSGGEDGSLCAWNVNRKKPQVTVTNAHGFEPSHSELSAVPRWISSAAAWTNTDLVASGSSDGYIRFWKCGERLKSLIPAFEVPCSGWVNSLEFSSGLSTGKKLTFVAVGVGKEHKLGRWFETNKGACNGILIIPIISKEQSFSINDTISIKNDDASSSSSTE